MTPDLATIFTSVDFWTFVGVVAGIFTIFALGLQIQFGFTGLLNFGHVAFMAIAAYTMAILIVKVGWPMWASALAAIATAMAFGDVSRDQTMLVIIWVVVVLTIVALQFLVHSPWGRVLRSIREDEDAASALGKNVFAYKLQALALGAALGAVAGLFFAFQFSFFSPQDFDPLTTFFAWIIVILGGAGRNWAVPVGAVVFGVIFAGTRFADIPLLDTADQAFLRLILIGLILIGLMAFRPQGIFGRREEMVLE